MIREFSKLAAPIARRVRLMIGRGVWQGGDDTPKMQTGQISLLADEVRDNVERVQQYGLTSMPHPGAEAVVVSVGGNRDHGLAIAVDDRRHRPTGLQPGEVALYTDENATGDGHRIALKRDQKLELRGADLNAKMTGAVAIESGTTATIKAPTQVNLDTPLTTVSGNITTGGTGKTFSSTGTWTHTGDVIINGDLTVNGNLQVNGDINATGDIIDGGSNTNHHTH